MVKFGIIGDTHIMGTEDPQNVKKLLKQIKLAFKNVDEIIHVGDVCREEFLEQLKKIAPIRCVRGNLDEIENLDNFIKIKVENYTIGVIHKPPKNLEEFCEKEGLKGGILIYGHTHEPLITGTPYNTLILSPGSPTHPKAPPQKTGFKTPVARPSVITLAIDGDIVTTFMINLKI